MRALAVVAVGLALVAGACAAQEVLPEPRASKLYEFPGDYPFFRYAAQHPFRPRAAATDPVNGAYLGDLSLLAYYTAASRERTLTARGFQRIEQFAGGLASCFVADRDGATFVVFQGTTTSRLRGALRNLKGWRREASAGGRVHAGYQECLDEVWPKLREALAERRRPVWFTGHSLGGALATLAASRFPRAQGVVTFGAPRVGDAAFVDALALGRARYVNGRDPVPETVPAWLGFRHTGAVRYLSASGVSRRAPRASWVGRLVPVADTSSRILDHAMLGYALRVTNALARGRAGIAGRAAR